MNTWRYLRVKDMARLGSGSTPKSTNEAYYEDGTYPWLNTSDVQDNVIRHPSFYITDKAIHECSGLREYPKDTLLFAMYGGGTIGNVGLMTFPSRINQACCAMVFHKNFCAKFLFYSFQVHKHKFVSYGFGGSQVNLSQGQISSFGFYIPPLPVQRRIVSYLDSKTSEIDQAISLLERKREAYTRLKASVINRAVTRGLNPDVKLKDSGVEWIGKIPEGWKVKRFKEIFTKYTTGATPNSKNVDNFEGNNTWVTIADMTTKYVTESNLCLSDKSIKENQIPITRKGSLMFSFKLSIGKVAFASKDLFTNEAIVTLSPSKKYDLDYFYYYLPLVCDNNATENIYGAKMMNQKIIANMSFALPPLPEQRSIASYLDAECSKIERAASIVEKQIDAYKRLKRSLINEVVTGKRKVD